MESTVAERQLHDSSRNGVPGELHAPDAEISVLGAMLIDGAAIDVVLPILSPADFTAEGDRILFRVMAALHRSGSVVDPTTLAEQLRAEGELDAIGAIERRGLLYIADLLDAVPTAANIRYHADIVRDRAWRRRRLERRDELERARRDPHRSLEEIVLLADAVQDADRRLQESSHGTGVRVAGPMFTAADIQFGRYMLSDPPERRWLIRHFLPLEITGLLAAMGGAGKSMLLYQLAFSAAGGTPFLGMPIGEVGGVLYMGAEDDDAELHRRGRRILAHLEGEGPLDRGALGERLHVVSRVAEDNLLTARHAGEIARTRLVDQLIDAADKIPHLKLIVLDPAGRFRGGKANEEDDATRFVEAMEAVRAATGACVLASVHVNKASIKDAGEGGQEIVRGSTAIVDSARWCAALQYLRKDSAEAYGVAPDEAKQYVRLELVKSNYTALAGLWLKKLPEGVMVPTELEKSNASKTQGRADAQYQDVLDRVVALLRSNGPLTRTRIEADYSGTAGILAAGQKTVRAVLMRAVQEGLLLEQDNIGQGGGRTLTVPESTP